jgi:hypothetical protein
MDARTEAVLKLLLCVGAVAVLARRQLSPGGLANDRAGGRLVLAAVVAVLAYTNFGQFNGWPPLHQRELFHYFLGSKYSPELRHDGLYVASMGAQFERHPELSAQPQMRDLRTQRIVPLAALEGQFGEVRGRFSDTRWRQFVADHDYFVGAAGPYPLNLFRLDHGYNPSPTWTCLARVFASWLPARDGSFLFLASLDLLLMGALCFGIFEVFGGRIAAMVVLLLGLGAPWRYDWIGGAFLRADWLAALGLGICALARERFALAGGLIGYAAMVRIFPAAFLVGPACVALRQWMQGHPPLWFLRLAAGVFAALTIGLVAGSLSGNGFAAWPAFLENLAVYRERLPTNGIGLESALVMDRAVAVQNETGRSVTEQDMDWEAATQQAARERRPLIIAAASLLIAMALAAMWKRPPHEAAVLGSTLLFATLSMASYYWIVLALVPLAGETWLPTAAVLAFSACVFGMILATHEQLALTYGAASWALLLVFALWLTPWSVGPLRSIGNALGSRRRDANSGAGSPPPRQAIGRRGAKRAPGGRRSR